MSRRKLGWRDRLISAKRKGKTLNDLMPDNVKGEGLWLTKVRLEGGPREDDDSESKRDVLIFRAPPVGKGEGNQVSLPMSTRKEQMIRKIEASLKS